MEENKEDIIYDLEASWAPTDVQECVVPEVTEPEVSEPEVTEPESEGAGDGADVKGVGKEEVAEEPDDEDSAENRLRRMVEEMGAETVLEIIKNNRNAAISQIISEVTTAGEVPMPSGNACSPGCSSIFDLAALA